MMALRERVAILVKLFFKRQQIWLLKKPMSLAIAAPFAQKTVKLFVCGDDSIFAEGNHVEKIRLGLIHSATVVESGQSDDVFRLIEVLGGAVKLQ